LDYMRMLSNVNFARSVAELVFRQQRPRGERPKSSLTASGSGGARR
jgi:hypothetical protein